jgi:mitochondrial pyruvate carrier 1
MPAHRHEKAQCRRIQLANNPLPPNSISGPFTASLAFYSGTFMRYSMAVTPKNYLLFLCHFVNFNSQLVQGYRWYDYW